MSKTRLKKCIEEKRGDHSNVYKTIVKKGIEGLLGYCANGPITIGKSEFEGGMANCAQKWKLADICKQRSAGRLHAKKKQQDCSVPAVSLVPHRLRIFRTLRPLW